MSWIYIDANGNEQPWVVDESGYPSDIPHGSLMMDVRFNQQIANEARRVKFISRQTIGFFFGLQTYNISHGDFAFDGLRSIFADLRLEIQFFFSRAFAGWPSSRPNPDAEGYLTGFVLNTDPVNADGYTLSQDPPLELFGVSIWVPALESISQHPTDIFDRARLPLVLRLPTDDQSDSPGFRTTKIHPSSGDFAAFNYYGAHTLHFRYVGFDRSFHYGEVCGSWMSHDLRSVSDQIEYVMIEQDRLSPSNQPKEYWRSIDSNVSDYSSDWSSSVWNESETGYNETTIYSIKHDPGAAASAIIHVDINVLFSKTEDRSFDVEYWIFDALSRPNAAANADYEYNSFGTNMSGGVDRLSLVETGAFPTEIRSGFFDFNSSPYNIDHLFGISPESFSGPPSLGVGDPTVISGVKRGNILHQREPSYTAGWSSGQRYAPSGFVVFRFPMQKDPIPTP